MKQLNSFFIVLVFILAASSCRSTKESSEILISTDLKIDSSSQKEVITIYKGITDTVFIDSPCDSLGNIKPIHSKITTALVEIEVKSTPTGLVIATDIPSLETSDKESNRVTQEAKTIIQIKEVKVKTVVWSKWTYIWMLIAIIEFIYIVGRIYTKLTNPISLF